MKITEVRTRSFSFPHDDHVFHPTWQPFPPASHGLTLVEVHTDEGITGIGSGGVLISLDIAAGLFTGRDPLAIEQHVGTLKNIAYFMGRPWPVEIALWDIAGKVAGLPLYKLLRGEGGRPPPPPPPGGPRPARPS